MNMNVEISVHRTEGVAHFTWCLYVGNGGGSPLRSPLYLLGTEVVHKFNLVNKKVHFVFLI